MLLQSESAGKLREGVQAKIPLAQTRPKSHREDRSLLPNPSRVYLGRPLEYSSLPPASHALLAFKAIFKEKFCCFLQLPGDSRSLKEVRRYMLTLWRYSPGAPICIHCDSAIIYCIPTGAMPAGVQLGKHFPTLSSAITFQLMVHTRI